MFQRGSRYSPERRAEITLRVWKGEPLPQALKAPSLPDQEWLRRWRREQPEWDATLKSAMKRGGRQRGRDRAGCTPQMTELICERLVMGASLHSLSKEPDMPAAATLYDWVRATTTSAGPCSSRARSASIGTWTRRSRSPRPRHRPRSAPPSGR